MRRATRRGEEEGREGGEYSSVACPWRELSARIFRSTWRTRFLSDCYSFAQCCTHGVRPSVRPLGETKTRLCSDGSAEIGQKLKGRAFRVAAS